MIKSSPPPSFEDGQFESHKTQNELGDRWRPITYSYLMVPDDVIFPILIHQLFVVDREDGIPRWFIRFFYASWSYTDSNQPNTKKQ